MSDKQRLGLLFTCNDFVFNLDIAAVERLVLGDELVEASSSDGTRIVTAGGKAYAAFNFGRLLGLPPSHGAGVLIRTVYAASELRFCLETGPCLLIRPEARMVPLGPGLFRGRRRALVGAFIVPEEVRQAHAPIGFSLGIDALLTTAERGAAAKALQENRPPAHP